MILHIIYTALIPLSYYFALIIFMAIAERDIMSVQAQEIKLDVPKGENKWQASLMLDGKETISEVTIINFQFTDYAISRMHEKVFGLSEVDKTKIARHRAARHGKWEAPLPQRPTRR